MPKIFADFERISEARKAIEALKNAGFKGAHLDIVDKYYDEHSEEINAPGTGRGPSLSALVLKSTGRLYDPGKAPLLAANPMVSGFGSFREIADANTRLAINIQDGQEEEVKKILADMGGSV